MSELAIIAVGLTLVVLAWYALNACLRWHHDNRDHPEPVDGCAACAWREWRLR